MRILEPLLWGVQVNGVPSGTRLVEGLGWGGHDMGPGLKETRALGEGAAVGVVMGTTRRGEVRNSRRKRRNAPHLL